MARRRPVPFEWREEHHRLTVTTRRWGAGGGWQGSALNFRSRGYCSCGAQWPESNRTDNLHADDVRDYWNDHVEEAYYTGAA